MAGKHAGADRESHPGTEPFMPDFDTGSQPLPVAKKEEKAEPAPEPPAQAEPAKDAEQPEQPETLEPAVAPVAVPGRYQYLKWWKLVLVIAGVWIAAAEVGLSLFYWWHHTIDKTGPVFTVLVYVVACSVAGVLLAMVESRPMLSALALGTYLGGRWSARGD